MATKKKTASATKKASKVSPVSTATIEEIIAPVWRSPDDDELRAVVGDALLEAGSPWGELVALQLKIAAKKATLEEKKLALVLAKRHRDVVGGAIAKIASTTNRWVCHKGFLAECAIERRLVKRPDWEAAATSPYWSTVKRVRASILVTPHWWLTEWAKNPAIRNIRILELSNLHLERDDPSAPWRVVKADHHDFFGRFLAAFALGLTPAEQKRLEIASTIQPAHREMLEREMLQAGVMR